MQVQELLDKVSEAGVSLWDLKSFKLVIKDDNGIERFVKKIKVVEDDKKVQITVE